MINEQDLIRQVKGWQARGLLSEDTADTLILDVQSKQTASPFVQSRVIKTVMVLGGLLVGLGILLFIASNWKFIPDYGKMFMIFAGLLGCHYLGIRLKPKMVSSHLPNTFHLIATMIFTGGIILLGQIFHLNADYGDAFIWAAVGSIPLAYALNSRPILSFGLLAGYTWLLRSLFLEGMLGAYYLIVFVSLGLGIYLVGEIQDRIEIPANLADAYRNLGSFTVIATLFIASFSQVQPIARPEGTFEGMTLSYFPDKFVAVLGGALILFLYSVYLNRDQLNQAYGHFGMVVLAFLVFWQTMLARRAGYSQGEAWSYSFVANASLIAALAFFFSEGVRGKDKSLVNIAMIGVMVTIIARYVDYFAAFLPRSLAFSTGGLILIGLGYLLEKKRKSIYRQFGIS